MKRFWILGIATLLVGCARYEGAKTPEEAPANKQAGGAQATPPATGLRPPPPPPPPESFAQPGAPPTGAPPAALPALDVSSLPKAWPGGEATVPAWAGQDKDEPFDVKQFLESRAAPKDNAAPLYFAAMAEISTEMYRGREAKSSWPWKGPPPRVKTLHDRIGKLSYSDKLKDRSMPLAEIEPVLAAAQRAERLLDAAQQKPKCVFIARLDMMGTVTPVQAARQLARLSRLHLYHAQVKGDYEQAERSIRRALRLSRDLRPRADPNTQLVSFGIVDIALSAIRDFTLPQPGLSAAQCGRLLGVLEEHRRDPISPVQEGMRVNYIVYRDTLDAIQHGRISLKDLVAIGEITAANVKFAQMAQSRNSIHWQTEAAECNRIFAAALVRASLPLSQTPPSEPFRQVYANLKEGTAPVMLALLQSFEKPEPDALRGAEARRQASLAGTECLVALKRYALVHGTLPRDLQTATREAGLPSVPVDAFSGKRMQYRTLGGNPLVYSVGPDRKDDGGLVEWQNGRRGDLLFRMGQ